MVVAAAQPTCQRFGRPFSSCPTNHVSPCCPHTAAAGARAAAAVWRQLHLAQHAVGLQHPGAGAGLRAVRAAGNTTQRLSMHYSVGLLNVPGSCGSVRGCAGSTRLSAHSLCQLMLLPCPAGAQGF